MTIDRDRLLLTTSALAGAACHGDDVGMAVRRAINFADTALRLLREPEDGEAYEVLANGRAPFENANDRKAAAESFLARFVKTAERAGYKVTKTDDGGRWKVTTGSNSSSPTVFLGVDNDGYPAAVTEVEKITTNNVMKMPDLVRVKSVEYDRARLTFDSVAYAKHVVSLLNQQRAGGS